jgi:hypothetical protein
MSAGRYILRIPKEKPRFHFAHASDLNVELVFLIIQQIDLVKTMDTVLNT